jgi:RNA polymerase sigma-54 factor
MLSQKTGLIQDQRLKLSPQLFQSIQLMALPLQDLQQKIQEEVERNPALEILGEPGEAATPEPQTKGDQDYDPFENSSDPGYSRGFAGDEDSHRKFLEGAVYREESLTDILMDQLHLEKLTPRERVVGEYLIQNLNHDGFHLVNPLQLINKGEEPLLEKMIGVIRKLEPRGCCTTDYLESLVVQSGMRNDAPDGVADFILHHLPLMQKGKAEELKTLLKMDDEDMENMVLFIKTLNPFPGRSYSRENPQYVIPDLRVRNEEGELKLYFNDELIPQLGISEYFTGLQDNRGGDKETRQYVTARIREAQWFLGSIRQRNETLLKTARVILDRQREFFYNGTKSLKPLTLKDVAEEIGVHETTVSRITSNKYIQTEWGIFELKYFFSGSASGSAGSDMSREAVKETIREILAGAGEKKLSDQKIADLLSKKGITVARRTVAKYRGELDIESSFRR